jgi:hypothetical protein
VKKERLDLYVDYIFINIQVKVNNVELLLTKITWKGKIKVNNMKILTKDEILKFIKYF